MSALSAQARSHLLAEVFRAVMEATARPGRIHRPPALTEDAAPLSPAAAAIAIALTDGTAPLWLAPELAADPSLERRLRFETGGAPATAPGAAAFVIGAWPALRRIAPELPLGAPERPDLSATLVVEVEALSEAPITGALGLALSGPGVPPSAPRRLWIAGVDADLVEFLAENRARFPLGLDLLLTAEDQVAALPRRVLAQPIDPGDA